MRKSQKNYLLIVLIFIILVILTITITIPVFNKTENGAIVFLNHIIFVVFSGFVAREKGRNVVLWVVLSFLIIWIPFIIISFLPYTKARKLEINDKLTE